VNSSSFSPDTMLLLGLFTPRDILQMNRDAMKTS
jgi:hypothetical protein